MPERLRELAAEDGLTLIELTIASLIMVVGLLALVSGLDHSRNLVSRSEKVEVASHQAERAIERVLARRYDDVALTSMPADSEDPSDPRYWVEGTTYQWDRGSSDPTAFEPLCSPRCPADAAEAEGVIAGAEEWEDPGSRLDGWVHTFVTEKADHCTSCPGNQPAKRVTVGVTVEGEQPLDRPVVISTLMIDPAETGS
jgi:Tfp pilus assembly protein PilV